MNTTKSKYWFDTEELKYSESLFVCASCRQKSLMKVVCKGSLNECWSDIYEGERVSGVTAYYQWHVLCCQNCEHTNVIREIQVFDAEISYEDEYGRTHVEDEGIKTKYLGPLFDLKLPVPNNDMPPTVLEDYQEACSEKGAKSI